ncbi:MAG TPA: autotransporter-associated beta strand repeat-containing protein [Chthoniobacterales bacterium]|jgi:autotransporter-associated beta strand protein
MKISASFQLLAVTCALFLISASALAGDATWLADPTNGDWNTAGNWMPKTVPNGAGQTATFAMSNQTSLTISADTEVGTIAYTTAADSFSIAVAAQTSLTISGVGIMNASDVTQSIATTSGPGGLLGSALNFTGSSTAGNATVNTPGGDSPSAMGGTTTFSDTSSAGSGSFLTTGSQASNSQPGVLVFSDNSTAGSASFMTTGSHVLNGNGAAISFAGHASAGSATLTMTSSDVTGTASGGQAQFSDSSTAEKAMLIATGGIGLPGTINFLGASSGGKARVALSDNAGLDVSGHDLPGMTIGSVEGNGLVHLGANTLTVGANGLSTIFAGVIDDGGAGGSLTKIGTGTWTLSGDSTFTGTANINAGKLIVGGSTTSDVIVNTGGILGGAGAVGSVTVNNGGTISPGDPKTLTVNGDYEQNSGATLTVAIGGTTTGSYDQLHVTGHATLADGAVLKLNFINGFAPHTGDTFDLLSFGSLTGSFGTIQVVGLADGFQYKVETDHHKHIQLTALSDGVPTSTAPKLLNISTRLDVETGDQVLIAGFIVTGSSSQKVIVRALGPSVDLRNSTAGLLADPVLELHKPDGTVLTNDNWKDRQEQAIMDSGVAPTNDLESAIVATLAPGAYTAIVRGKDNGTGIGLVEVFDLDQPVDSQLANISTRGFVQTGDDVMIGGFIVGGAADEDSSVILRALGPSLADFNVDNPLQDPVLELHNEDGDIVASDDDWQDSQKKEIEGSHLAPTDPRESALAATLAPGSYTIIERGKNNTTGVGLIEIYRLPSTTASFPPALTARP